MSYGAATRYVGTSVSRVEDRRILSGSGRYADDIFLPGMVHGVFVRSPIAHGTIRSIGTDAARRMPGVVAILTGADLAASVQPMRFPADIPNYLRPVFHALACHKVRFVGDPVALVVADSRYRAEDASDRVDVEYDELEPVITMEQAADKRWPTLFEDIESNVLYSETMTFGDPDAAFQAADDIVERRIGAQRVAQVPMEGRGGVADFRPGTGELTYHAGSQVPHALRQGLAGILGHPADRLRVVIPDIGGAFGQKSALCREDVVICAASRLLGRPVKWVEDRVENLTSAGHAREETMIVKASVKADGTILGLDVEMSLDQGAYPLVGQPAPLYGWLVRTMIGSAYRIDHMRWSLDVYATNKATYTAYRGPWGAETLVRETLIDQIGRALKIDPVVVRLRNLITADEQPRKLMSGPTLEGVLAVEAVEEAAILVGYKDFREEQRAARKDGRLIGIGFSTYIEPAPGPPDFWAAIGASVGGDRAVARLEPDGHLTVITTQAPHGQGHETTIAQVAATEFGVPFGDVRVLYGDTDVVPYNVMGTGGSRAATMASGSALLATRAVKGKVLAYAAEMLEIAPGDLDIAEAKVVVHGDPQVSLGLAELAQAVYAAPPEGEENDLRSTALFNEPRGGWSGGTHVCLVEVDRETGTVLISRYQIVEDCGALINPAIADGQIRGGVAQGIGQALYEDAAYDSAGNFVAGTFVNYLLPTAMEIPVIDITHLKSEPLDEVSYRGVGEGGTIAAPAAVINAVSDALGGVSIQQLPLTPERVLTLIDSMDWEQTGG